MMDYYSAQALHSLQRIKREANYCLVLIQYPGLIPEQELEKALENAESALDALRREYLKRKAQQNRPPSCDPENPQPSLCEECPNNDIHVFGGPYCKLSLRALD